MSGVPDSFGDDTSAPSPMGGRRGAPQWPARRPLLAVGLALLVGLLAALSAGRLRPDASLQSFFAPRDPAAQALVRVLDRFPSVEKLLILVTVPEGEGPQPQRLLAFAERFERRVKSDPHAVKLVTAVNYRADAQSREFVTKVIVPNGLFYLSDEAFAAARRRLTREGIDEQLRQDEAILAAPGPAAGALAKAILQDPLRLHEFIQGRLAAAQPLKIYPGSDALISTDGRNLLIALTGAQPPSDLAFCRGITATVTGLANEANTDKLRLELTGAYPIAAQSERSIRGDSISSVVGSITCLALLFGLAFRRPLSLFAITMAPLALGILSGFGVYALFSHSVSPLTAVIGAMLAGIGIDYSIFYLVHYLERRARGESPADAACDTASAAGSALFAAWVTSVVGFIAVGFASVRVLRDFSIAGSLGLAGALAGAVCLLPALWVLLDRGTAHRPPALRFSVRPLLAAIDRRASACLAISGLVVVGAVVALAVAGPRLPLETDPTVLHPRPNPPLDAQAHVAQAMGGAGDSLVVYLHANSSEELVTLAHRVNDRLTTPLAHEAGVSSTVGLATLLPDPAVANKRLGEIGPALADRVMGDFDAAVADSSFDARAFAGYRAFLRNLLQAPSVPKLRDLIRYAQLSGTLLPREAADGIVPTESITLVFLRPTDGSDSAVGERTVATLRRLLADLPGATLTGIAVLSLDTQVTIRHDLPRLIAASVAFIAVYLLLHFRSLTWAALALLPTACGLICLLAAARFTGARMNLANIVAIPLLIGIDGDYGIFLISAARRCTSRRELIDRVAASGQAVLLCAAATLLGFGSLAFTSVPAIRTLGWAVAIGVSTCAAATLFFLLPLLIWKVDRRSGQSHSTVGAATLALLLATLGWINTAVGHEDVIGVLEPGYEPRIVR